MTEENKSNPTGNESANSEPAPPMNRAERRAAAKGKKSGPAGGYGANQSAGGHPTGRPGGIAGQMRLPRTGHKGA